MANNVFKRYEIKYFLTNEQYKNLKNIMQEHMEMDEYGLNTINNIYFDTPDYRLIRKSIEKPCYKEKLRVRSYGKLTKKTKVFVEMKKKYNGVVYKRRLTLPQDEAFDFLLEGKPLEEQCQIAKELSYFMKLYGNLEPAIALVYDREAFFGKVDEDFRITFDHNVRVKLENIDLSDNGEFKKVLDEDLVLLEVKTSMGMPAWLLEFFSANHIYKTSFSKYGTAYKKFLLPKLTGGVDHVA